MIQRVPTGVPGFDKLVENGLPVDSVTLLAGNPGTGKTTFAAQYIYEGATKYGERGVYVCFAETKRTFLRNMMRFEWDFERLETEGRVAILDPPTTREAGLQSNLNTILEKINYMRAKRLVIDSFTAMSTTMKEPIEVRFLVHQFYRFFQTVGCTTLLITDTPWGTNKIGSGVEEFIVDGIVLLESLFVEQSEDNRLQRRMKILKMRSTNHSKVTHKYEITEKGLQIL